MTEKLRGALHDLGETTPALAVPAGLFDRARRAHRRRRAVAAVIVLVLVVLTGYPLLRPGPAPQPGQADEGLPSQLVTAPPFTAELQRAPLPRALAVYSGPDSNESVFAGDSYPLIIVGPNDQYRRYYRPEWTSTSMGNPTFLLSPDGRTLLMPYWVADNDARTRLLDVTTGSVQVLDTGAPLAWSPDGRQAVLATFGSTTATLVPTRIVTVDVPSGRIAGQITLAYSFRPTDVLGAAMAADGSVAVQQGTDIGVYRADGTPVWKHTVDSGRLAGPAAFTPDGGRLAIMGTGGRLSLLDAATGLAVPESGFPAVTATVTDEWRPGPRVVAWRGDTPVIDTGTRLLLLSDPPRTLLTAPTDSAELEIATDAVDRPPHQPGSADGGPIGVRPGLVASVIVVGIALALLAAFLLGRRRASRRVGPARRTP